ncbi:MAG: hypothetical protein HY059_23130, partial [Proteobacteria bacterium]|nr:hypothetical protein [Pseudomonadota bacterium]
VGGYAAGYYGYLYSEVFAQDMFTRFEQGGVLNPDTGRDYRRSILAKGSSEDEMDLMRQFLRREPNSDAFLRSLGVNVPPRAEGPSGPQNSPRSVHSPGNLPRMPCYCGSSWARVAH